MIWKIFQIVLWLAAAAYAVVGLLAITGMLGSAREADSLRVAYAVFGSIILIIGVTSAGVTFLANKWRGWLILAPLILCLGLPVAFFGAFWIDLEKGDVHRRQIEQEIRSGRYDFSDQPALLAVAQAISANDQDAISAAAKAVPDLQAAGRDGTTLLCWAVRETWQRPQLVESVRTLLALGADPNFTNGHRDSFAMGNAVHGSARLLQSMLDAGGNPNARDEFGRPIILMNWYLGYYKNDQRARLDLLLIAAPISIPRCPKANRKMPVIRYCSIAREWDLIIATRMRMRCICSSAAQIRTASPLMERRSRKC